MHVSGRVVTGPDGDRRVLITVRDGGRWREPRSGPSSRGHGMVIMRTCAERFAVEHGPAGTTVELVSRPA
ncbi:hypothetical protein BJF78_09915 [Pseudonocardia sp. CNS-139]|nr:hypothetical protein BJF78_09915 [Pseudonocardia sp. CNS-139]